MNHDDGDNAGGGDDDDHDESSKPGLAFLFANMFSILVETCCPDHNEHDDDNVGPWVVMMMIMMIGKPGLGFLFENMFSI